MVNQQNQPKKLRNRFDEWEVLSIFVETTSEQIESRYSAINKKFYAKCILGSLMALNAYLSHFGPWTWPHNFYILVFSVFFFLLASTIYGRLGDINPSQGSKVGEFIVDGVRKIYAFKLTPNRVEYVLQIIESETKEIKRKQIFNYLEYFTEDGDFLKEKFIKRLRQLTEHPKL